MQKYSSIHHRQSFVKGHGAAAPPFLLDHPILLLLLLFLLWIRLQSICYCFAELIAESSFVTRSARLIKIDLSFFLGEYFHPEINTIRVI